MAKNRESFRSPRQSFRTRTEIEDTLRKIINDPLKIAGDPEFEDFTRRQFVELFGTDPVERDATGRTKPPSLKSNLVVPFRPGINSDQLVLSGPVNVARKQSPILSNGGSGTSASQAGRSGLANDPANVLRIQKALSNTGDFVFDMRTESSGGISPRFGKAVRSFQDRHGLKVDGLINPDGPTVKKLSNVLFGRNSERMSRDSRRVAHPALSNPERVDLAGHAKERRPSTKSHADENLKQAGRDRASNEERSGPKAPRSPDPKLLGTTERLNALFGNLELDTDQKAGSDTPSLADIANAFQSHYTTVLRATGDPTQADRDTLRKADISEQNRNVSGSSRTKGAPDSEELAEDDVVIGLDRDEFGNVIAGVYRQETGDVRFI